MNIQTNTNPNIPKLRFSSFEDVWNEKCIGNVSTIFGRIGYRGYTVNDIVDRGKGVVTLSPSNFKSNRIDITKSTYITVEKYEESPEIKIFNGDILFVKTGSTYGKIAYVDNLRERATINPQIVVLKDISINSKFLFYIVLRSSIRKQVEEIVVGGAIPTMSQKELAKMTFHCPLPPEQHKIATFLSAVDTKIQQLQRKKELLGQYKKGVMLKIFSQEIRFKDEDGNDYPDWNRCELGMISTVIRGASPRPKGDSRYYGGHVPRLMVQDVTRDGKYVTPKIDFLTEEGAQKSRPCNKGTLTIVCSGTVGVPSILAVDACIHDGFLALANVDNDSDIEFLYYTLLPLQQQFEKSATHGGVFINLTTKILSDFKVFLPSLQEQRKIATFLSRVDQKIDQIGGKLNQWVTFKRGLLQQMFV
jgi:type I restriction enzyme, S subunit